MMIRKKNLAAADYPLDVKLGQMLMVGFRGATVGECQAFLDRVGRYHVGGVWLTDNESPMGVTLGNIRSPGQLKEIVSELQRVAVIPLFVAIDAEGGQVIRIKEKYGFPAFLSPQTLGDRNDLAFTHEQAALLASTLADAGINLNLAPVVDLNTNPANPVIGARGRSFSPDPDVVIRHATAFIEAHHQRGIMCGIKHFPGHGSSSADSHLGLTDVTDGWSEGELMPYRELVRRRLADVVLTAHIMLRHLDPDHPATLSGKIITGLLRKQIGFDGAVISDDLNMGAVRKYYSFEETIEGAVGAGVDVLLHGNVDHYDEAIIEKTLDVLHQLVASGRLTVQRVDESFNRIMTLKRRYLLGPEA